MIVTFCPGQRSIDSHFCLTHTQFETAKHDTHTARMPKVSFDAGDELIVRQSNYARNLNSGSPVSSLTDGKEKKNTDVQMNSSK